MPSRKSMGGTKGRKAGGFGKSLWTAKQKKQVENSGALYVKPDPTRVHMGTEAEQILAPAKIDKFVKTTTKSVLQGNEFEEFLSSHLTGIGKDQLGHVAGPRGQSVAQLVTKNGRLIAYGGDSDADRQMGTGAVPMANPIKSYVGKGSIFGVGGGELYDGSLFSRSLSFLSVRPVLSLPQRQQNFRSPAERVLDFAEFLGKTIIMHTEGRSPEQKIWTPISRQEALRAVELLASQKDRDTQPLKDIEVSQNNTSVESCDKHEVSRHNNIAVSLPDGLNFDQCLKEYFTRRENAAPLLTKEELETVEEASFTSWRRQIAQVELATGTNLGLPGSGAFTITPYEKNLAYWKQLWRTVERSDFVIIVMDARNPLLFRSQALESLISRQGKKFLLLINKTDLLSNKQRAIWEKYLTERGLDVVFYSAKHELLKQGHRKNMRLTAAALQSLVNEHGRKGPDNNLDADFIGIPAENLEEAGPIAALTRKIGNDAPVPTAVDEAARKRTAVDDLLQAAIAATAAKAGGSSAEGGVSDSRSGSSKITDSEMMGLLTRTEFSKTTAVPTIAVAYKQEAEASKCDRGSNESDESLTDEAAVSATALSSEGSETGALDADGLLKLLESHSRALLEQKEVDMRRALSIYADILEPLAQSSIARSREKYIRFYKELVADAKIALGLLDFEGAVHASKNREMRRQRKLREKATTIEEKPEDGELSDEDCSDSFSSDEESMLGEENHQRGTSSPNSHDHLNDSETEEGQLSDDEDASLASSTGSAAGKSRQKLSEKYEDRQRRQKAECNGHSNRNDEDEQNGSYASTSEASDESGNEPEGEEQEANASATISNSESEEGRLSEYSEQGEDNDEAEDDDESDEEAQLLDEWVPPKKTDFVNIPKGSKIHCDFLSVFFGPKSSLKVLSRAEFDELATQVPAVDGTDRKANGVGGGNQNKRSKEAAAESFVSPSFWSSSSALIRPVIGVIGFPNVGKSSLINSLMQGAKRVGVSRTPGKTRHLQTLPIPNSDIILCDCPGLVLPIATAAQEDLLINNIMAVDNFRGSLKRAAGFVLERVSIQVAEVFKVKDRFRQIEAETSLPIYKTPDQAVAAIAEVKKLVTSGKGGIADVQRACKMLLKQFGEGEIFSWCEPPPQTDAAMWRNEELAKWEAKRKSVETTKAKK